MSVSFRSSLASMLLMLATACALDLPISERIEGIRPLGLRIEANSNLVPEPEDGAVRAEALPTENIRLTPFIVDDQGPMTLARIEAEIDPMWLACPLQPAQGLFACLSGRLPLALDTIAACPPVDFTALDPASGQLPPVPTPCRIVGGTPAEPQMQVPLDFNFFLGGDLEITMIGHRPGDVTSERCAEALLSEQSLPPSCLIAVQRASVGPDAAILRLAAEAGLDGLDGLGPIPSDDQIPDADRHPRIQGFRAIISDKELAPSEFAAAFSGPNILEIARGDTITAALGQTIVIETTAPDDDRQTYWIRSNGTEFEPRQEQYEGNWFRTWGTLLSNDSDDPVSFNAWTMVPGEQDDPLETTPSSNRATLYYVLRDDRQGIDWWWFHVMVE